MRHTLFSILLLFIPLLCSAELGVKCNQQGNQAELNSCAADDFDKADKELNQVYQSLIKKEAEDVLFIRKLRIAQKAWLTFRDAELDAIFACADNDVRVCWGSMYPMSFFAHKANLTRQRTAQLREILTNGRGE